MEIKRIDWDNVPADDYYKILSGIGVGEYVATLPASMEYMYRAVFFPVPPVPPRIKLRRVVVVVDGERRRAWQRVE